MAPRTDCVTGSGGERLRARGGGGMLRSRGACLPVHSVLDIGRRAKLVGEHLGDARHLATACAARVSDASSMQTTHTWRRLQAPRGSAGASGGTRRRRAATTRLVAWVHDERDHGRAVAARRLEAADQLRRGARGRLSARATRNGRSCAGSTMRARRRQRAHARRRRARLIFHISMLFSAPVSSAMVAERAEGLRGGGLALVA